MLSKKNIYRVVALLLCCMQASLWGQTITGTITDKSGMGLPGTAIRLLHTDSSFVTGAVTDVDGTFTITVNSRGNYILQTTYLGYRDKFQKIALTQDTWNVGKIVMQDDAKVLSEVKVEGVQVRGEQKGDTTQFNADAYKTHPDATVEDLVKKMPGITSDNNGINVNGESVKKVLVDGKPFFGDDPNAALKNLPADIVDKVEIFDKASDQAQFTGFNDGDQQKTINVITKKGKNQGIFGKAYGGYGTDDRYNAGGTINSFNNSQRISLLLLSNNINQQNFSISDIMGVMSNSGQSPRGGGGGGGGQGAGGGNSGPSNLLTGQQSGITATQSAGLNYTDTWGKKINVSGSYFFNYTDNKNQATVVRHYFTDNGLVYNQNNNNSTKNPNHRFNLRFEYQVDSANKITEVPSLSFQNNKTLSAILAQNRIGDGSFLSGTNTNSTGNNDGYNFSNSLLFQHKFHKKGRTISLSVATQLSEQNNDGSYVSSNQYGDSVSTGLDQRYGTYSNTKKIAPSLIYTEPAGKNGQLLASYNPSYTENKANKVTNDRNTETQQYTDFDASLSNIYSNVYETQRGGLGYKYNKGKLNTSVGVDAQYSTLQGKELFPVAFAINRSFTNILPNAFLNYRFSKTRNLNINYRSTTNIPSVTQLQNVLDISNPLQIKSGNADLKQTFENNLNMRIGGFNTKTARNLFFSIGGNYTNNYISNATYILHKDSVIEGYHVKAGSQLTKPLNLDNYWTSRVNAVYGFPIKAIKCNLNLNGGFNYSHTPSLINGTLNMSNSYATNGGLNLGSNISSNIDFSLAYNGSYYVVKNSMQKQSDNSYFTHTATFRANWIFLKGFVLNTDISNTLYSGLSQNYNQQYFLWNAYFGYKFFKNRSLEAKVSVFDLLNQNRSISRTITGTYTEDSNTTVLKRYFMFTLTYTFKSFKSGSTQPTNGDDHPPGFMRGMPPPGGGPPGGPGGPPPGGG